MKIHTSLSLIASAILVVVSSSVTTADDALPSPSDIAPPTPIQPDAIDRIELFDSLESSGNASKRHADSRHISVAELRQRLALERESARNARVEYNAWIGRDPLRPAWNAVPMTSSRYAPTVIYVPVYLYGR